MKYLLLAYTDEKKWDALSQSEKDAVREESAPYVEEVRKGGHIVSAGCLKPVRDAITMRPRNGKVTTTDGPFVETKEQIGAFMIIEARDLNEAIQVASMTPGARMGERLGWGMEVRPIEEVPHV